MIARDFMTKYGEELTGATICGTCGVFPIAEETIAKIDRLIDEGKGDAADPDLGGELLGWNVADAAARIKIGNEWICHDPYVQQDHAADPLTRSPNRLPTVL